MGQRGPKKQSDELQKRKGNPGRRSKPISPDKQDAISKLPAAPPYMTRIAGAEWRRAGESFVRLGKLTHANLKGLEAYSFNYGIFREAQETLKSEAAVLDAGKNHYKQPHPAIAIARDAQNMMIRWLKVILDTTVAKAEAEGDPLENFFKRAEKLKVVKGDKED